MIAASDMPGIVLFVAIVAVWGGLLAFLGRHRTAEGTVMDTGPVKTHHHLARAIHPTPARIKAAMDDVDGINAKIAVVITKLVGSMWCAYLFAVIAFLGLSPALKPGGEGLIAWIAQTFLQLVLLSVIMVGQAVQSAASDARSEQTYEDTVKILDALNVNTEGGIRDLRDELLAAIAKTRRT